MAFRTNKVPAIEERTVSGSSVSFNSAFALPLKACKTEFMFTQSGTGDPSPQNVCPFVTISDIIIDANTNTFTVDLNGNRAGGIIDLVNKTATITWIIQKISDMQVAYQPASTAYPLGFYIVRGTPRKKPGVSNVASEIFKVGGINWTVNYRSFGNGSNDYIYVVTSDYSSADDFKSNWGTYEFAYELATPIEISLSDIPDLFSIIGNNTFSTDTGTLEITFADLQEKSASGSVATFNTALAMPLVSCNIAVNAWQEGSGDPSPSNVRTIHGFDKVRVGLVNFNQITRNGNFSTLDYWGVSVGYGDISVNNNECVYTFTIIENGWYQNSLRYGLYMIPTHKYFFSSDYYVTKPSKALIYNIGNAFYRNKILAVGWNRVQTIMNASFSTEGNKSCYIGLVFCEDYNYQVGDTYKMKNVMAFDLTQMFGSRIADYLYNLESNQEGAGVAVFRQLFYKDYYDYNVGGTWVSVASVNGDNYPDYAQIQLGQEVYGAEVDVVNGVAHVDIGNRVLNGSEDNWVYRAASNSFYLMINDMRRLSYSTEGKCNKFATVRSLTEYGVAFGASNTAIYFNGMIDNIPEVTDLQTWKTWLSNNNVQVIYPLAEPFDIQLTPTQIETIIGNNTIFADTGDVDLTYNDLDLAKRGSFREVFKLP